LSFAFLVAGFLATTNAGRVALASRAERPAPRTLAVALLAGLALIALGVLFADDLLDALAISPESFRVAAGIVLGASGVRTIVWPQPSGPFGAILVTPALACLAVSFRSRCRDREGARRRGHRPRRRGHRRHGASARARRRARDAVPGRPAGGDRGRPRHLGDPGRVGERRSHPAAIISVR
jgi:hypothetical protein